MNAYHRSLLCILIGCVLLAACATPEQVAAGATAVAGTAVALFDALKPMLSEEQVAKLHTTATHIDGTVDSLRAALGAVADAVGTIRSHSAENFEAVKAGATHLAQQVAAMPTHADLYGHDTGTALVAYGASRAASARKHGFIGKRA